MEVKEKGIEDGEEGRLKRGEEVFDKEKRGGGG